jgi:hypothetical protein
VLLAMTAAGSVRLAGHVPAFGQVQRVSPDQFAFAVQLSRITIPT